MRTDRIAGAYRLSRTILITGDHDQRVQRLGILQVRTDSIAGAYRLNRRCAPTESQVPGAPDRDNGTYLISSNMTTAAQALAVDQDDTLALARAGDPNAFAGIVRRHQAMVFSLALHVLGSRAAAEDLAQEVFLELYRALPRLESPAHVTWWLRRVTSHRCIDELRRARHRLELPMEVVPDRGAAPPSRELFLESRLQHLVSGLPPRARMVMVLRYQEELEPLEIAHALNMPVNTVKSHLRRSLAVLRARLLKERHP